MSEQVRVELVPRMVDVDDPTLKAAEADVAAAHSDRSEALACGGERDIRAAEAHYQETSAALAAMSDGPVQDGWLARINGAEVPVVTFGVEPPERGGRALVSLLIPADSVRVGDPSTGEEPQVRPATPIMRPTWGTPGPDPREGIAGWAPQVAEAKA